MKIINKYIIFILLISSFILVGCNKNYDSELGDTGGTEMPTLPGGTYSAEVSNLQVTKGDSKLTVSWDAPADTDNLGYYVVEWKGTDRDKARYSTIVKKGVNEAKLVRLYNEEYEVSVKCANVDFIEATEGVTKKESPNFDTKAPGQVENLIVSPLAGTCFLKWDNPTDEDYEVTEVAVYNATNDEEIISVVLPLYSAEFMVQGLSELSDYYLKIRTVDYIGNTSEYLKEDFRTLTERFIEQNPAKPWEVVEFSSEATNENPPALAKSAIDLGPDKDDTFWHSSWGPSLPLPQYIVIDIQKPEIISAVVSYRRLNNNSGPTTIKIEGKLNYEDEEWIDLGTTAGLDPKTDAGQVCGLKEARSIRFVKFSVLASPNGYAMIRDVRMKALVDG